MDERDAAKTRPKKDPGRVAAGKRLGENNKKLRKTMKDRNLRENSIVSDQREEVTRQIVETSFALTQMLSVANIVLSLGGM